MSQVNRRSTSAFPDVGDVDGPASAVDSNFAAFDGTSGKLIKDSGFTDTDFLKVANDLSDVNNSTTSFDNISPTTTKGDLIVNDGTNNVRLPVGTDGKFLVSDSTATEGVAWSNEVYIEGSGQTIGAVTADLITLDLGGTAGAFSVQVRTVGFESTTPAGAVYQIDGGARTTGAAATLIGQSQEVQEEGALTSADVQLVVSSNNLIVRATGVAALTIDWTCSLQYILQT